MLTFTIYTTMSTGKKPTDLVPRRRYEPFLDASGTWTFDVREYRSDLNSIVPTDLSPHPGPQEAYRAAGVTDVINIVDLYLDQFTMEIEHPKLQRVATLGGGAASIVIVSVPEDSSGAGETIAEITQAKNFPEDCVIAGIYREDEFIIPRGKRTILSGDRVFLAAATNDIEGAARYLGVREKKWFEKLRS